MQYIKQSIVPIIFIGLLVTNIQSCCEPDCEPNNNRDTTDTNSDVEMTINGQKWQSCIDAFGPSEASTEYNENYLIITAENHCYSKRYKFSILTIVLRNPVDTGIYEFGLRNYAIFKAPSETDGDTGCEYKTLTVRPAGNFHLRSLTNANISGTFSFIAVCEETNDTMFVSNGSIKKLNI
jgi:hypothetical protein